MTTEEKKELIIAYLKAARQMDRCAGYKRPAQQGGRAVFAIFAECFNTSFAVHGINYSSTTRLCNRLVREGILERCTLQSSHKYYRIKEEI